MNQLDEDYKGLLGSCLYNGIEKTDRTGTGTLSVFGRQIKHRMEDGFPLLTTKKMPFKTIVTELLWFLRGDTNIKYLVQNGCNIWTGDAYKHYMKTYEIESRESGGKNYLEQLHMLSNLTIDEFTERIKTDDEFAKKWGELGPIYGSQWRKWVRKTTRDEKIVEPGVYETSIDQIQNLINELKTNPDSRRLMVSAWNVGELDKMILPPCHYGFQVYTRKLSIIERGEIYRKKHPEKTIEDFPPGKMHIKEIKSIFNEDNIPTRAISLMWNQRSVDTFLGLPFNIASYATLLIMLGKEVNMMPDYLIGSLGDVHLYKNHIEQAKELITRTPYKLPKLEITNCNIQNGEFDYELIGYQSHPTIKAPLSN
jgi:thymidylate synthase